MAPGFQAAGDLRGVLVAGPSEGQRPLPGGSGPLPNWAASGVASHHHAIPPACLAPGACPPGRPDLAASRWSRSDPRRPASLWHLVLWAMWLVALSFGATLRIAVFAEICLGCCQEVTERAQQKEAVVCQLVPAVSCLRVLARSRPVHCVVGQWTPCNDTLNLLGPL